MGEQTKVGIIGAGWPGMAHARGYMQAGGFKVVGVADLIPARRQKLALETRAVRQYATADELLADDQIDAVSICLPNHLHAPVALAALKAGKHVLCENPPTITVADARKIGALAEKHGKVVLYSFPRRFGGHEMAAKQTCEKGYAGEVFHIRASWMRTRGIPAGTGWFTKKQSSGGGALIDLGLHMLDLAWWLLGQPRCKGVYATTHQRFTDLAPGGTSDVEDSAFALLRFENGASIELASSWAINQPPQQQGVLCRVYGSKGAIEVYTPQGAVLFRQFDDKGSCKSTPLKPPRVVGHPAMIRHFRQCILGQARPLVGPAEGVSLMDMIQAIYKSASTGRSAHL